MRAQEYREAVAAGHGAYLMEEEKADVFSVAVGNLPPRTSVLIKITYVAGMEHSALRCEAFFNGRWNSRVEYGGASNGLCCTCQAGTLA